MAVKLFNLKHNVGLSLYKSKKEDLLYNELITSVTDYISPQSNSHNINMTIKSNIKENRKLLYR